MRTIYTIFQIITLMTLYSCVAESDIDVSVVEDEKSVDTPPSSPLPPEEPSIPEPRLNLISLGLNGNSCAIDAGGSLYCWGENYDNDDNLGGLVGSGNSSNTSFNTLQDISGINSFKSVSMGENVGCAITQTDSVMCWGRNFTIGDSTFGSHSAVPRQINDSDPYIYVDSGSYHSCGITSSNILKCYGDSWGGKLGRDGNNQDPLVSDTGTLYLHVSAGRNHTCGITTEQKLKCFGYNSSAQIGIGTTDTNNYPPTQIDASEDYIYISSTENGNCAITTNNKLKCWGADTNGRTGNGSSTGNVVLPEVIDPAESYKMVDTGPFHTCAITTSNKLKCWGRNDVGQLGTGTTSADIVSPITVDPTNDYKEVAVGGWGGSHTCALRLNGDLFCWGGNSNGQLGLGDNTDRTAGPVEVQASFN